MPIIKHHAARDLLEEDLLESIFLEVIHLRVGELDWWLVLTLAYPILRPTFGKGSFFSE